MLSEESSGFETEARLQREKKAPSCAPTYAKLRKPFGDRKGRKEEDDDPICTNPMLLLADLAGEAYFMFIESKGRCHAPVRV